MMKRVLFAALMVSYAAVLSSTPLQAQGNTPVSAKIVHDLQQNADAAASNAAIYQWKRVNLEVDRVVAAARKLPDARQSQGLKQAIQELRSSRTNRDREGVVAAAQRLLAIVSHL